MFFLEAILQKPLPLIILLIHRNVPNMKDEISFLSAPDYKVKLAENLISLKCGSKNFVTLTVREIERDNKNKKQER